MNLFEYCGGNLQLEREPPAGQAPLQAWDAADRQLLDTALTADGPHPADALVINDQFGALALGLIRAGIQVTSWGDSFVAHWAALANAERNQLPQPHLLKSTEAPAAAGLIVWRLPKSLDALRDQIQQLRNVLVLRSAAPEIWIGAMQKHVPERAIALLERHLGAVQRQPLRGKAILWRVHPDPSLPPLSAPISCVQLPELHLTLNNMPTVFCRDRVDPGSALLLEQIKQWPTAGTAADLGCGSGVLGLALLREQRQCRLWGFDDSYQAIASAAANARYNLEVTADTQFKPANIFTTQLPGQPAQALPGFDLILCNPPFHQQHVVGDHIAWRMFKTSHKKLNHGGELWVVGNRHLGYHIKLKRLFGNCRLMASDRRFVVLRCQR